MKFDRLRFIAAVDFSVEEILKAESHLYFTEFFVVVVVVVVVVVFGKSWLTLFHF